MPILERIQHLRITEAQNAAFTGESGEIVFITDTTPPAIAVHDGSTAGGHLIGQFEQTLPVLLAEATGDAGSSSDYANWTWDDELLEPDGSNDLTLSRGRYVAVLHQTTDTLSPLVTVAGNHAAALAAETFKPALLFEYTDDVVADVPLFGSSGGKIILHRFDSALELGGNTLLTNSSIEGTGGIAFSVLSDTATVNFQYDDLESSVSDNVTLSEVILKIYGRQQ